MREVSFTFSEGGEWVGISQQRSRETQHIAWVHSNTVRYSSSSKAVSIRRVRSVASVPPGAASSTFPVPSTSATQETYPNHHQPPPWHPTWAATNSTWAGCPPWIAVSHHKQTIPGFSTWYYIVEQCSATLTVVREKFITGPPREH